MDPTPTTLPVVTKDKALYFVTIYEFPKATVRHQQFVDGWPQERVTTFDRWIELEAQRITSRTSMKFGVVHNSQGQMALAALKN